MGPEHYFSEEPTVPVRERLVRLPVGGRTLTLTSASGVFSAAQVDPGTALLLRKAPFPDPRAPARLVDVGCGYGPIALALAAAAPAATVYAVDVNRRALALVRRNAEANGLTNVVVSTPDEVDQDLCFHQLWSNPPIRIGKDALHEMLGLWLPRLTGTGWLVVARHLGADSLQAWLVERGFPAHRHASAKGYRILRVEGDASPGHASPGHASPGHMP